MRRRAPAFPSARALCCAALCSVPILVPAPADVFRLARYWRFRSFGTAAPGMLGNWGLCYRRAGIRVLRFQQPGSPVQARSGVSAGADATRGAAGSKARFRTAKMTSRKRSDRIGRAGFLSLPSIHRATWRDRKRRRLGGLVGASRGDELAVFGPFQV